MRLVVDQHGPPSWQQIANQMEAAITTGELLPLQLLPSIREISYSLNVNRDAVHKAYRALAAKGLIFTRPPTGIFVMNTKFLPGHKQGDDFSRLVQQLVILAKERKISFNDVVAELTVAWSR